MFSGQVTFQIEEFSSPRIRPAVVRQFFSAARIAYRKERKAAGADYEDQVPDCRDDWRFEADRGDSSGRFDGIYLEKRDVDDPVYSLLYDDIDYLWTWLKEITTRAPEDGFPTFIITIRFTGQVTRLTQKVTDVLCYQGFVRYGMKDPDSLLPQLSNGPVANDTTYGLPHELMNIDNTS